jgi:hypothetical protein
MQFPPWHLQSSTSKNAAIYHFAITDAPSGDAFKNPFVREIYP